MLFKHRDDINKWANDLRKVHPYLAEDMEYVKNEWADSLRVSIDELHSHTSIRILWDR